MKTSKVIELKANEHISIQQEFCGYTINGPITVIVIEEAAAVTTARKNIGLDLVNRESINDDRNYDFSKAKAKD